MRITSRKNPTLLQVKKLLSSPSLRRDLGQFVGDGQKLLQSALDCGFPVVQRIYSQSQAPSQEEKDVIVVPDDVMSWLSPMKSPQGVLFVAEIPSYPWDTLAKGNYILLDRVQDPGNVGTIWRTAHGLGAKGMILLGDCADPWSAKTVRSSMGACFQLPCYQMTGSDAVALFQESHMPLYGTALCAESHSIEDASLLDCGLILGNEGQGISPDLLTACTQTLYLPMAEGCQSLNVAMAGTICLWEMQKARGHRPSRPE